MTADLKAIRARAEAATPGPWHASAIMDGDRMGVVDGQNRVVCREAWSLAQDARFAAHAREDIPALLDLVETQGQEGEVKAGGAFDLLNQARECEYIATQVQHGRRAGSHFL